MTRRLRIALAGGFGNGNFGNDASLEAAIGLLRDRMPNAELSCICDGPDTITERFGLPAMRFAHRPSGLLRLLDNLLLRAPSGLFNWARSLIAVSRFDVVLFPGTGVFDDYRTGPMGFPAQVFRWSVAARLSGARLIFMAVGAGPIINPISRFFLKSAAACADHRSYRDAGSKAFMAGIGLDESDSPVVADIVFAMPVAAAPALRDGAALTIGLGVMSYRGWRIDENIGADYVAKLVRFIRHVEGRGHRVRLLVSEPSDLRTLASVKAALADDVERGGEECRTLHDVITSLRECDVAVASRYHVLIAALKLGRPCISLSYGPKHDDLLDDAGIAEFRQHADRFDFDLLCAQLDKLTSNLAEYGAIVAARVIALQHRATSAAAAAERAARE